MYELGLEPGLFTANACHEHDTRRIQHSQNKSSEKQMKRCKRAVKNDLWTLLKTKKAMFRKMVHIKPSQVNIITETTPRTL